MRPLINSVSIAIYTQFVLMVYFSLRTQCFYLHLLVLYNNSLIYVRNTLRIRWSVNTHNYKVTPVSQLQNSVKHTWSRAWDGGLEKTLYTMMLSLRSRSQKGHQNIAPVLKLHMATQAKCYVSHRYTGNNYKSRPHVKISRGDNTCEAPNTTCLWR